MNLAKEMDYSLRRRLVSVFFFSYLNFWGSFLSLMAAASVVTRLIIITREKGKSHKSIGSQPMLSIHRLLSPHDLMEKSSSSFNPFARFLSFRYPAAAQLVHVLSLV
jgi:hypothetical protein